MIASTTLAVLALGLPGPVQEAPPLVPVAAPPLPVAPPTETKEDEEAALRPAAPRPAPPAAAGEPDVGEILGERFVGVSTTKAMEKEVEGLRRTLDALVGRGEDSADILNHLDEDVTDLEGLGIGAERAEEIRGLANDVNSLRAQLQLLHLQGRTASSPDEELRDVKDLLSELAREASAAVEEPRAARVAPDAAAADAPKEPAVRISRFPQREAVLAFRAGDDAAVAAVLQPLDRAVLSPEVLYAYGCALVNLRELDEARIVLGLIEEHEDRELLRFAAKRQIRRVDHLANGIVSLDPLLKEGRDP